MGYYMAKREVNVMVKLGDLITIESSSKQLDGDLFWLLNLDMVEQQTGNIIEYNYVNKNQLKEDMANEQLTFAENGPFTGK